MQRLFQKADERLRVFIGQHERFLLLLRCRDEECPLVLKMLQSIDESSEHVFWTFAEDFRDPSSYVQAIARTFYERGKQLSEKLSAEGEPPWPPLPPRLGDPSMPPVERMRALFLCARDRIPDLEGARLVVALAPLHMADPLAWRQFMRALVDYEPRLPWCHHIRLIARESAEVVMPRSSPGALPSSAEFFAATASSEHRDAAEPEYWPATEVYAVDLSVEAMHAATKEDMADRSLPLAERANALLIDAAMDYTNRRYEQALAKYTLLSRFAGAVQIAPTHALALNGMGEVFAATGRLDAAVEHFEMAMTPAIESKSYPILLNVTLNLGNLYLTHERWTQAGEYYTSADALAGALLNAGVKLLCLENIGVCHHRLRDHANAQRIWLEGVKLAKATEEREARKRLLLRLRGIYEEGRMVDQIRAIDDEIRGLA